MVRSIGFIFATNPTKAVPSVQFAFDAEGVGRDLPLSNMRPRWIPGPIIWDFPWIGGVYQDKAKAHHEEEGVEDDYKWHWVSEPLHRCGEQFATVLLMQ